MSQRVLVWCGRAAFSPLYFFFLNENYKGDISTALAVSQSMQIPAIMGEKKKKCPFTTNQNFISGFPCILVEAFPRDARTNKCAVSLECSFSSHSRKIGGYVARFQCN